MMKNKKAVLQLFFGLTVLGMATALLLIKPASVYADTVAYNEPLQESSCLGKYNTQVGVSYSYDHTGTTGGQADATLKVLPSASNRAPLGIREIDVIPDTATQINGQSGTQVLSMGYADGSWFENGVYEPAIQPMNVATTAGNGNARSLTFQIKCGDSSALQTYTLCTYIDNSSAFAFGQLPADQCDNTAPASPTPSPPSTPNAPNSGSGSSGTSSGSAKPSFPSSSPSPGAQIDTYLYNVSTRADYAAKGYTAWLKVGEGIAFNATLHDILEYHTAKVKEIGSNYVIVTFASHPQDVRINLNETKAVDVNGDGINDIQAKYIGILDSQAGLLFSKPSTPKSAVAIKAPTSSQAKHSRFYWAWIIAAVGLIVAVIAILVLKFHLLQALRARLRKKSDRAIARKEKTK